MKRSIFLVLTAAMLSMVSSCGLLGSVLKIPTGILKSVGRTAGIGLTDDKPQPIHDEEIQQAEKKSPTPVDAAE